MVETHSEVAHINSVVTACGEQSSPDLLCVELGACAAVVGGLLPEVARHVEDAHAHLLQAAAGRRHNLLLLVRPDVEVLVPAIKGTYYSTLL